MKIGLPVTRVAAAAVSAAAVLGLAAFGLAGAQQVPAHHGGPASDQHAFWDALAARLGISPERLQQAIPEASEDVHTSAPAHSPGGAHALQRHDAPMEDSLLSAAAHSLGISLAQLQHELAGSTLTGVAQAHGREPSDVASALKTDANEQLDHQLGAGVLTADQVRQRKQLVDQHIDQLMVRTFNPPHHEQPSPHHDPPTHNVVGPRHA